MPVALKLRAVAWVLLLLAMPALGEEIRLPFSMGEDDLCFLNSDPDLARVDPVLGRLGVKEGVCQGIAAISGALLRNVEFRAGSRPTEAEGARLLSRAVSSYLANRTSRVVVEGYRNAREFCAAHRDAFLRKSIYANADIAAREILVRVPELFSRKKSGVETLADRKRLLGRMQELREELRSGRPALMLLWKHVVLIYGYRETPDEVVLSAYDSNSELEREFRIALDSEGLPVSGQPMIWDITPHRRW